MKAAAYARYSTDNQKESSIAYQMQEIRKYCAGNNIDIVMEYKDEGFSGTNMDRPGFQSMVMGAQCGLFSTVVVYDISRGSRDVSDWFAFRKQMVLLGIDVISATGQKLGNMLSGNDFLVELLQVGMGQMEVLNNRQKSIDSVAVLASEGVFLGGVPPIGYDIVDGKYVINSSEAEIVRKIFHMYADGKSYDAITEALNGAVGKRGAPLGRNSYHAMLKNERYIGVYSWNKRKCKIMRKWAGGKENPNAVRIEGVIPPIIDMVTWERVQMRIKDNKRKAKNRATHEYLLSGIIECEKCGATYVGQCKRNQKGTETLYYMCGNKRRTKTCDAKSINASKLECFVIENLRSYLLTTDVTEMSQYITSKVNGASQDMSKENKRLAEINLKIENGTKAILSGIVYPELQDEMARLQVEKSELEDIIRVKKSSKPNVSVSEIEIMIRQAIEDIEQPDRLKRAIQMFVPKIIAHVDGSCTVNIGLTIGCGSAKHAVYAIKFRMAA